MQNDIYKRQTGCLEKCFMLDLIPLNQLIINCFLIAVHRRYVATIKSSLPIETQNKVFYL